MARRHVAGQSLGRTPDQVVNPLNPVAPDISMIIAVTGDYLRLIDIIRDAIARLRDTSAHSRGSYEIIFAVDEEHWQRAVRLDGSEQDRIIICNNCNELPAILFNRAAQVAAGRALAFASPLTDLSSWREKTADLFKHYARLQSVAAVAGHHGSPQRVFTESWLPSVSDGITSAYPSGWLELMDSVPMECTLISREFFLSSGGFSTSPLLQRGFWWEFCLRTARTASIVAVDVEARSKTNWHAFSFAKPLSISGDMVARRVVMSSLTPENLSVEADWDDVTRFLQNLRSTHSRRVVKRLTNWAEGLANAPTEEILFDTGANADREPLRVTVLGGLNEPAHNQLCFFNYFKLLEGKRQLTWRPILDSAATPLDLLNADIVIFSRIKTAEGCRLMDFCSAQRIPTIYMLDDNWFSIGSEWQEYANLFCPGAPMFDHFLHCMRQASCVLTYNAVLADDLKPYSKRLELLPTNIDLGCFPKRKPSSKDKRPLVGYVGSLRREDSAFQALTNLAQRRDDFDIFVMSTVLPDTLKALSPKRLNFQPYVFGYHQYARTLCEACPDILLAPLGSSRTEASKCPNKYLELSAAGSVGVYSNVPPYSQFIRDGVNGLLVENSETAWKSAIARLLDSPALRSSILESARDDVLANFATESVLPKFLELLHSVQRAPDK